MAEALYRKYRPQVFEDVVGQDNIERTLKNAIDQDKVSHAYLFCGPRGTGKTTTARLLAKALLCEHGPTSHPDGTCRECVDIANGVHPDVYELDAASRTGVDNVRDEIINRVNFAPTRGKVKVYIIDEVHMLSTAAFNALLKTLEEPPEHVIFILCTTDPQKVPETIHSRCQRFDFHRISNDQIVARLGAVCASEGVEFEGDALDLIAHRAEGGMRNALTSLEQLIAFGNGKVTLEGAEDLLGSLDSSDMAEIITAVGKRDAAACFTWVAKYAETGADMAQFARDMAEHVRNLYVMSLAGTDAALDVTDAERREMSGELKYFGPDRLSRLLCVLGDLTNQLRSATNPRLCFEIALTRMVRPDSDLTLESLAERVEALEARLNGLAEGGAVAGSVASAPSQQAPAPAVAPSQPAPAPAVAASQQGQAPAPGTVRPARQQGSAPVQSAQPLQQPNGQPRMHEPQRQPQTRTAVPQNARPTAPQASSQAPRPQSSTRTSAGRAAALAALQNARARSHGGAPVPRGNAAAPVQQPHASQAPVRPTAQPQQGQTSSQAARPTAPVERHAPAAQAAAPSAPQPAYQAGAPQAMQPQAQPVQQSPRSTAPAPAPVQAPQQVQASQEQAPAAPKPAAAPAPQQQPASSPKRAPEPAPYEVPAPQPSPQPANASSDVQNLVTNPAALQRAWHSVTVTVKREKVAFGVLLVNTHVRPDAQGAGVVIEFADDNPFAFQMAQKPEVQQSIKAAFHNVVGFDVPFTMAQKGADGSQAQVPAASDAASAPHTASPSAQPQPAQHQARPQARSQAEQPQNDAPASPASSAAARAAMEAARARVHGLGGKPHQASTQRAPQSQAPAQPAPRQTQRPQSQFRQASQAQAQPQPAPRPNPRPVTQAQPNPMPPAPQAQAQPQPAPSAPAPQAPAYDEPPIDDVPLSAYDDIPWETDDDPYAALEPHPPVQQSAPQPTAVPQQPAQTSASRPAPAQRAAAPTPSAQPAQTPSAPAPAQRSVPPAQQPQQAQQPSDKVSAAVAAAQARARAAMAGGHGQQGQPAPAPNAAPAASGQPLQQDAGAVPVDDSGNPLSAEDEAAQLGKMLSDTMGTNIVFKQVDE